MAKTTDEPVVLQHANQRMMEAPAPGQHRALTADAVENQKTLCNLCDKSFSRPSALKRHIESAHTDTSAFQCDTDGCRKAFTRLDTVWRHIHTQHGSGKIECPNCRQPVRKDGLEEHQNTRKCVNATVTLTADSEIPTHTNVDLGRDDTVLDDVTDDVPSVERINAQLGTTSEGSASPFIAQKINIELVTDLGDAVSMNEPTPTLRQIPGCAAGRMIMPRNMPPESFHQTVDPMFFQDEEYDPQALLKYDPTVESSNCYSAWQNEQAVQKHPRVGVRTATNKSSSSYALVEKHAEKLARRVEGGECESRGLRHVLPTATHGAARIGRHSLHVALRRVDAWLSKSLREIRFGFAKVNLEDRRKEP